ncbi:hypothetical protein L3Q67_32785 [Saccharothrix sp. AJ9571]|nr:hypothetical protein L3Q67_32785 [Saccharothrix sp. AJ9571]
MDVIARVQQFMLLCALTFAVVGMHHLLTAPSSHHGSGQDTIATAPAVHDMATETAPQHGHHPPSSPAGSHDVLHLCFAVLCSLSFGLLLLAMTWLRTALTTAPPRPGLQVLWTKWRPPERSGRSLLTALCIHRL